MSRLLYLGSEFFTELLLSVSRLLYLGSQFFIELLLSVEQNINWPALQLILICLFCSMEVNFDLRCYTISCIELERANLRSPILLLLG